MVASTDAVEQAPPVTSEAPFVERRPTPTRTVVVVSLVAPALLGLGIVAAPFSGGASLGVAVLLLIALVAD
jgi:hypothetical protein